MAQNINTSEASDLATADPDYSVDPQSTDAQGEQKETKWTNEKWTDWFGYYKQIPELHSVINAKASYTVGKGIKGAEEITSKINGWGKDTFSTIIENMIIINQVGGDAYAEIIRNKSGKIINLKPLDPGAMVHVVNSKGRLKRFEQNYKIGDVKKTRKFKINEIFYLPRNRVADEIHGTSIVEKLEETILMRNEAMADMKLLLHRHVKPFAIYELNTDDTTKIKAFKDQKDAASKGAENIYVAMGSVKVTPVVTQAGSIGEARAWIEQLNNYFYQSTGVPKVILGDTSGTSEAGTKMGYFAFQQIVEEEQLSVKTQVKEQLGLNITLEKPASLEKDLQRDEVKDGNQTKPSDTKATMGGKQV